MITGLIPEALLLHLRSRDNVLFFGADLPLGYAGAPLSRPELAEKLAKSHSLPANQSWPQTAQAYLGTHPNDRHGLITFLSNHSSGPAIKPGPVHTAIAKIGFKAIVTAWHDELLEQALRDAGYRVNRIVRDMQLPYAETGEQDAIVIKLFGCLSDPDSLSAYDVGSYRVDGSPEP